MEKNCSFQIYLDGNFAELNPITKEEGLRLLERHRNDFIRACKDGEECEIALWINMAHSSDYNEKHVHINSNDVIIKNGTPYTLVPFNF